jgi:F0F1-type ATP synthase epsilon subunit
MARAEEAKRRAQEQLAARRAPGIDETRAEASLHRALARIKVAEKVKRRRPRV